MKNNINSQVEMLAQENVRLYEENMRLKLMLKNSDENASKSNPKRKSNKTNKNNEVKEPNEATNTRKENDKFEKSLSKFQQEREAKKAIVLAKRKEKVPVPEIAKAIGQSEPTVRNYIRELRVEGKLVK